MAETAPAPFDLLRPGRKITGISAVLLPWRADGNPDWAAFEDHLRRTVEAGLQPAVNMDTGYVERLDAASQEEALRIARDVCGNGDFVAGAAVTDAPGDRFDPDAYAPALDRVCSFGATPVVFPSFGLAALAEEATVEAFQTLASRTSKFVAFELSPVFNPAGRIWSIDTFRAILGIEACIGAKHSSLNRAAEWERLRVRDEVRPEFRVLTGNDLAIDMVCYGSDYLLGLSSFAPDAFARRDALWAAGDPAFHELNDALQYLGSFAFRPPVPAYKHSAGQFLVCRGQLAADHTPPGAPRRPDSDIPVLREALGRIEALL